MESKEDKLKNVLSDVFQIDSESISDTTSVDTVEKWNSLNHLKLVLALEQAFDVSFTEEQTVEILNYPLIKMVLKEHGVEV